MRFRAGDFRPHGWAPLQTLHIPDWSVSTGPRSSSGPPRTGSASGCAGSIAGWRTRTRVWWRDEVLPTHFSNRSNFAFTQPEEPQG